MKFFCYKRITPALIFALGLGIANSTYSDVVVIVNASNDISSISKSDLHRIFLGKTSTFSNNSTAVAINQYYSSETRALFDKKYLRKTPQQSKAFWSKQLFTGQGTPPEEVPGDLDALQKVAKNKEAISYIDSSAVNKSVKVIDIK